MNGCKDCEHIKYVDGEAICTFNIWGRVLLDKDLSKIPVWCVLRGGDKDE